MRENIINSSVEDGKIEIIDSDHLVMAAVGDHLGLPFEYMEQMSQMYGKSDSGLNKFSSKYIREPLPDPEEDKDLYALNPVNNSNVKNAYKFGFVLLEHKDYDWKQNNNVEAEKYGNSVEINFTNTDNKTTDDTEFMMEGGATFVKHESQYQLTTDKTDYTLVSKSENFKTLTDDYTNEFFTNIQINHSASFQECGQSMIDLISAAKTIVNDKQKNPDSTYAGAFKICYKK